MAQINILDSNTINQIAAGEVVERPSSVVKELVENAIDAKATAITVEIKDGGIGMIRITDNGTGIEKSDIPVAFLRHSTSKIKSVEDLLVVASLGFRGEALSSIASVAQVELITKTPDALMGVRYLIDGGQEKLSQDIGCPSGTTIIVRNLFYNTPARRKFLKTAMTEAGYVNDLMQRLALSHPEISFKFINNNQIRLHTVGNMQLKDIIYSVFGRDIASNLLEVDASNQHVRITGFVCKPLICRGNRAYENYFINGRYIKSGVITKAIEEAYKTFIMIHKFPMTALHFEIDTSLIDVNVHPAKMEIRFNNSEEIYQLVFHAVRDALEGKSLIPKASFSSEKEAQQERRAQRLQEQKELASRPAPEPFETSRLKELQGQNTSQMSEMCDLNTISESPTSYHSESRNDQQELHQEHHQNPDVQPRQDMQAFIEPAVTNPANVPEAKEQLKEPAEVFNESSNVKPVQMELFDDQLLSKKSRHQYKLIGQVFETYWIVVYSKQMFIIDQHAAHEKVLYEKLVKHFKEKEMAAQYLNPPIILSLSLKEEQILKSHLEEFLRFGFEVESFGGNEYALRSVPMDLYGFGEKELIMTMIDTLNENENAHKEDVIINKMATAACKAAVKGNQKISFAEAQALIAQLFEAKDPYTCPHGRPTIISMTQYDLEKKFKRIQS